MESKSSRRSRPQDFAVSKPSRGTSVQTVVLADRSDTSSGCPHGSNCSASWMGNDSSTMMATVMMGPLYILSLNGQRQFDHMALKFQHFSTADQAPVKAQDRRELFRSTKSTRLQDTLRKDDAEPSGSTKAGLAGTVGNLQATKRACNVWKQARSNRVDQISTSRDSTFLRHVSFIDMKSVSSFPSSSGTAVKKKPPFVRKPTGYCFVSPDPAAQASSSTPEPRVEDCENTTTDDTSESESEEQEDILLSRAMAHAIEHARTKGESFVVRKQPQQRVEDRSKAEYLASEALARMGCVGFPVRSHKHVLSQACTLM